MAEKNRQPISETNEDLLQESTQTQEKIEERDTTIRDALPPPDPPKDTEKE